MNEGIKDGRKKENKERRKGNKEGRKGRQRGEEDQARAEACGEREGYILHITGAPSHWWTRVMRGTNRVLSSPYIRADANLGRFKFYAAPRRYTPGQALSFAGL